MERIIFFSFSQALQASIFAAKQLDVGEGHERKRKFSLNFFRAAALLRRLGLSGAMTRSRRRLMPVSQPCPFGRSQKAA
jgi:hypothetical protein